MLFDALQHLRLRNFNNSSAARLLQARLVRLRKVSVEHGWVCFKCVRVCVLIPACSAFDIAPPPRSLHFRPISPAPESLTERNPNLRFSGSSAKRNIVALVGDAPGPVAMATAGLYLVQLFRCSRFSVFPTRRGEKSEDRSHEGERESGATSRTNVKQNPPARIMNSLACFSYLLLTL